MRGEAAAAATPGAIRPGTLLGLGRVSNLPTVWTNGIAGTALAGGDPLSGRTLLVLAAMTLLYTGGMYLNDAFDRRVDAVERPTRPIPAGLIGARTVFGLGFAQLAAGAALLAALGPSAGLAGLGLGGAILLYDAHHKGNPAAPLVMGLCRCLVYAGAGAAASGTPPGAVLAAGAALLGHVAGLTYAARQEALDRVERSWPLALLAAPLLLGLASLGAGWPVGLALAALVAVDGLAVGHIVARSRPGAVPRAVGLMIAAISLVDALAVAPVSPPLALLCAAGFPATLLLHRWVPGT